ncbi:MAG: carboxypeptidase-like regulatory domain-containing protein, partial [Acidobacteriota bacterium]
MTRYLSACLLTLMTCVSGPAQTLPTVSLSGTVSDQDTAFVSGAQVLMKGIEQPRQVSTITDGRGAFRFENVNPGNYELLVTREGFNPTTLRVKIGQRLAPPLKITLAVADLQQEVSIAATTAQANTEAEGNLDVVRLDRTALSNLPALDQNYIGTLSRFLDGGAVGAGGVTLVVDGMEASKVGVSASAIQEIKINNNPFSAEYSRPGRGRIEIITKPGSTKFHGEFNFLFRDQHFNARDVFATERPAEQRRIFEGNFSGPLSKSSVHPTTFLISFNREEEDLQAIIFAQGPEGAIQGTFPKPTRQTEFSLRLSRQMTKNSIFSILYSVEEQDTSNQGVGGFNLPEVATTSKHHEDGLRFNHNWVISPRLVSQISFLLERYDAPTTSVNSARRIVVQDAFAGGGA